MNRELDRNNMEEQTLHSESESKQKLILFIKLVPNQPQIHSSPNPCTTQILLGKIWHEQYQSRLIR